ncbi:hypothetical protein [Rarobacter incanus]|uniref:Uncharacterized protein n=1 Tax=Rarobacter incanus TaxID=153494 RepID=A0A542SRH1_9MICO|nr:hypothetical protein [Rarobacter incanus]TQK77219.1 hypothetical protein FB389_1935 [Rarobacter incanus]
MTPKNPAWDEIEEREAPRDQREAIRRARTWAGNSSPVMTVAVGVVLLTVVAPIMRLIVGEAVAHFPIAGVIFGAVVGQVAAVFCLLILTGLSMLVCEAVVKSRARRGTLRAVSPQPALPPARKLFRTTFGVAAGTIGFLLIRGATTGGSENAAALFSAFSDSPRAPAIDAVIGFVLLALGMVSVIALAVLVLRSFARAYYAYVANGVQLVLDPEWAARAPRVLMRPATDGSGATVSSFPSIQITSPYAQGDPASGAPGPADVARRRREMPVGSPRYAANPPVGAIAATPAIARSVTVSRRTMLVVGAVGALLAMSVCIVVSVALGSIFLASRGEAAPAGAGQSTTIGSVVELERVAPTASEGSQRQGCREIVGYAVGESAYEVAGSSVRYPCDSLGVAREVVYQDGAPERARVRRDSVGGDLIYGALGFAVAALVALGLGIYLARRLGRGAGSQAAHRVGGAQ